MAGLFGSSGVRRPVDAALVQLALNIGLCVGNGNRRAIVGCDHRTSSEALKHAMIAGLLAAGCEANDAGIAPTPTIAYAARGFDAGAMITASHNPPQYNGVKLLNPDGSSFDSAQRDLIEAAIEGKSYKTSSWNDMKKCAGYTKAIDEHIARILEDFPQGSNLKVVVDCRCGAASTVTPRLLQELGCEVVTINCEHDGCFEHIEPSPQNLEQLSAAVVQSGADLGIANDGDGDRLVAVDDKGRVISGDELMAIFARQLDIKRLVTPIDTSMALEEMGFEVVRTRVGDSFVSEELKRGGDFGGEQSGCWIFPSISYCPDGIYASAKIVDIARDCKLSDLLSDIPCYPILKGSIIADGVSMEKLRDQLGKIEHQTIGSTDGIRLTLEDAWVLVRLSGTEPKIRITVEARSEERAKEIYDTAIKTIERCQVN